MTSLLERLDKLNALQEELKARQEMLAEQVWNLQRLIEENPKAVRRNVQAVRTALSALSEETATRIEKLAASLRPGGEIGSGFNYFLHADVVGGARSALYQLYAPLVERFREAPEVLDLGCGTGVFLELLREAGIRGYGVDLDEDSVILCRKKGLDVRQEEAMAHLESLPDKSVGGIFAAHLIEHLPVSLLWEFVRLCHRKMLYGAPLVLVTPNGASLSIFYYTFYKDLTHNKPLHPEALAFLLTTIGFRHVEIATLSPMPDFLKLSTLNAELASDEAQRQWVLAMNQNLKRLNEILCGDLDCVASAVK